MSRVHPSTSIRARSFLWSPTLAVSTHELGRERMVNRAGPSARPDTERTPHPCGELRGRIVRLPRRFSSNFGALARSTALASGLDVCKGPLYRLRRYPILTPLDSACHLLRRSRC